MDIRKYLKIGGVILLIFAVLYLGVMLIAGSFSRQGDNVASEEAGFSAGGVFQAMAPTMKSSGAVTRDLAVSNEAATVPTDKKVIKTGSMSLKVDEAETAAEAIANIAKLYKGEVSSSSFYESTRGVKSGSITVRVPFNNFDAAFAEIKKVATQVVSESTNAQDITEQYIDLQARLKNKQAEEVSFAALLSRTGKIEEVLSVTRELARVRGEIEQLTGQIRYLNSQTDMSTITANITEDVAIATASQDWRPWQVVKTSVKQLITSAENFIDGLIAFVIVALPMLAVYALVIWLLYWLGRKIYRKFKNNQ